MSRLLDFVEIRSAYVNPPRWEDLRVPLTASAGAGVHNPTLAQFRDNGAGSTGVFSWSFSAVLEQELFFIAQLPHYYKQGTDLTPHVHWSPSDGAAGNVVWGLEYTIRNPGISGAFPLTQLITAVQAASGTAFQHQRMALPAISGVGILISAVLICRIYRSMTGNTYGSAAFGHEVDFHYAIDNIGSNNPTSKTDSGGI